MLHYSLYFLIYILIMKYIKLQENVYLDKLETLVRGALAYLLDDNELIIRELTGYYMIKLNFTRGSKWLDVKDEYLFFIDILLNDYVLVGRTPFSIGPLQLKSIDDISDIVNIRNITIFVANK